MCVCTHPFLFLDESYPEFLDFLESMDFAAAFARQLRENKNARLLHGLHAGDDDDGRGEREGDVIGDRIGRNAD